MAERDITTSERPPGPAGGTPPSEKPVGDLIRELSQQTSELVRKELELARIEMTEKGKRAGLGAGLLGGAGLVGLFALGAFTAFLILLLVEIGVDPWLSALIVTVLYAAVAGVLALTGKGKVQEATPPAPEQTVESVKEDVEWTKTRAKSGRT